ncbi:MAG TPA: hypothetical protein VFW87_22940 [Pirellulales bacterium]|nr:hypothetical protein [Pirellulales bacterium]
MRNMISVLLFVGLTALCWGTYGPILRVGQDGMGHSHWRPFICVGMAYFVIAILVPGLLLRMRGERGAWTAAGTVWSLIAGVATTLGALGIILAFNNGGKPNFVMPQVFGCAPVVNTLYTMFTTRDHDRPGPFFLAGLIIVATGAVAVMIFKPATVQASQVVTVEKSPAADAAGDGVEVTAKRTETTPSSNWTEKLLVLLFVAMTALCWGVYGPMLHKGQMLMQGSRLRPLICVGVAYFVIAVVVSSVILWFVPEHGQFTFTGSVWSLAGGAAGAIGALGVIMAFNAGGKPMYVMPLIFGAAPVINTFVSLAGKNVGEVSPLFYAGLILVVVGAVTVLVFAPKAHHAPGKSPAVSGAPLKQPAGA